MIRTKAYKFRIYPNETQKALLSKTFGCVRWIWNNYTAEFNQYSEEYKPVYKTPKELKQEFEWLAEVSQATLQQKVRDFEQTKRQFFNTKRKIRIGRMSFKKKSNRKSFRLPNQKFKLLDSKIQLEKIGKVRCVFDRIIPESAKLISVTVSQEPCGNYYASVCVEQEIKLKQKTNKNVGIDVGLKEFATQSDGVVIFNPKFFRESQSKIRKAQKDLSRKVKGSNRYRKQRLRLSKIHFKINNQRSWFLQNYTTELVNNYDVIVVEDLNVKGMLKNHKLAKSISDASWSEFFVLLSYKCEWYGKQLIKIDRFEPSSKTCSNCGWVKKDLKLSDRTFHCDNCNFEMDRDWNASNNILRVGVNTLTNNRGDDIRPFVATVYEAMKMN